VEQNAEGTVEEEPPTGMLRIIIVRAVSWVVLPVQDPIKASAQAALPTTLLYDLTTLVLSITALLTNS
jgi:hypothetical protein